MLVMDLARISGMKVEKLKNFLRLRGLRTYEEVDKTRSSPRSARFIEVVYCACSSCNQARKEQDNNFGIYIMKFGLENNQINRNSYC